MTDRTTLSVVTYEGSDEEDIGEVQGIFDSTGELLGAWSMNDAYWRSEYYDGFMHELGFELEESDDEVLVGKLLAYFRTEE